MGTSNFLEIGDFSSNRIEKVVFESIQYKKLWNYHTKLLENENLALVFQGPSTRTRSSFEIAASYLGAHSCYVSPKEYTYLKESNSLKDTLKSMESFVDFVVARIYNHDELQGLARYIDRPVINAMSQIEHPCQAIADVISLIEIWERLQGKKVVLVGESPVFNSLVILLNLFGSQVTIVCPPECEPPDYVMSVSPKIDIEYNLFAGVKEADAIYTDTWSDPVDMLSKEEEEYWIEKFSPYQINADIMSRANPKVIFMHCLPAKRGMEVTSDVLMASNSIIFRQAHNRVFAQVSILIELANQK